MSYPPLRHFGIGDFRFLKAWLRSFLMSGAASHLRAVYLQNLAEGTQQAVDGLPGR